jgi:hypothetical protein
MASRSRFFALSVNQSDPVHEGKKSREVSMISFVSLEFGRFQFSGYFNLNFLGGPVSLDLEFIGIFLLVCH